MTYVEEMLKKVLKVVWEGMKYIGNGLEGLWEGIIVILFIICLFYFAAEYDDDCLQKIAVTQCKEYDMVLLDVHRTSFNCVENERVSSSEDYYDFLDEELESCIVEDSR